MRPNRLRQLLKTDRPSIGTHIHTTWPSMMEVIGHTGVYDYVEFVAEYGPFDLHDLDNLCRAAELHNLSSMIKVDQEPRGFLAQRAIGSGFQSVLFGVPPRAEIGSPEQAKYYIDLGVKHFCIGTDVHILYSWWKNNGDELRRVVERS